MNRKRLFLALTAGLSVALSAGGVELENSHIRMKLEKTGTVWRMTSLARASGEDALTIESDEFEILGFDDARHTVDDYDAVGAPEIVTEGSPAGTCVSSYWTACERE